MGIENAWARPLIKKQGRGRPSSTTEKGEIFVAGEGRRLLGALSATALNTRPVPLSSISSSLAAVELSLSGPLSSNFDDPSVEAVMTWRESCQDQGRRSVSNFDYS